jgi:hypothetical protein
MTIRIPWALVLTVAFLSSPAAVAQQRCTPAEGTPVVNGLLSALVPVLDQAWPSFAVNNDLDPWMDPCDGKVRVNLNCDNDGGSAICAVQGAACDKQYLEVNVKAIYGLSYLRFKDAQLTSLDAAAGTVPCPYAPEAKGGPYTCTYAGKGSASAFLVDNGQIVADLSSIKVKAQCDLMNLGGVKWTETLYSGSATCTATQPKGDGTFKLCAGSCASGSTPANIEFAVVDHLDLELGKLECDVKPHYDPLNWIAESLVPKFKKELAKELTPPLEKALNDLIADYVPFPGACSK